MKKLALAAFAAALAASPAGAADLGHPAPAAVDYVKVCDAYGEGFFYIPGTETCLKVGGYVRAEYRYYGGDKLFWDVYDSSKGPRRTGSSIGSRARADIQFDARTNTEFGLLRSYSEIFWTVDSGNSGAVTTSLHKAYVQWGGLTAGRSQSFFDFYLGDHYASAFETAHSDSVVNLLAYTFSFGNGVSATLSLEDKTTGGNNAAPRVFGGVYGGNKAPDIVGNVNISQAWGSAQIMAAAHQDYSGGAGLGLANYDKWGYAVGGGVTVKLPMLGAGDVWSLQAAYSKGAISYVTPDPFIAVDFLPLGGNNNRQTKAWSVASGLTHNWTPTWASSVTASYAAIDFDLGGFIPKYNQFDIGGNLVWTSASGLSIGGELEYKSIDFSGKAAKDTDAYVALLRIQRNF